MVIELHKSELKVENYTKNFITNVIFRIDFPEVSKINQSQPPSEFIDKLKEKFPIYNQLKGESFELESKTNTRTIKQKEKIAWRLTNSEKNKIVMIDPAYLTFETFKYTNFDDFIEDIKFIFTNFFLLYPVEYANRIGLRYINQIKWHIKGNPFDWTNLLNSNLYSIPKNFISESDSIQRAMNVLEIEEDDYYLRFQFGLFNSEFPNPIARKEFVLDYDCYTEDQVDTSEIYKKVEEFNKIIYKWFERSIDIELRSYMRDNK
jgi:uncharacterized protein (TIGR04255 family)